MTRVKSYAALKSTSPLEPFDIDRRSLNKNDIKTKDSILWSLSF